MKMIPKEKRITLDVLNRVTQAWIEQDYHAGDNRLPEKLRQSALLPLESRIRIRHHLDKRPQSELVQILTETLIQAGAPDLMTPLLIQTVAEHAMGNVRAMMMLGDELLTLAAERKDRLLDENLFFETIKGGIKKKRQGK